MAGQSERQHVGADGMRRSGSAANGDERKGREVWMGFQIRIAVHAAGEKEASASAHALPLLLHLPRPGLW